MQSEENKTTVEAGQEQETPLNGPERSQNAGFDDSNANTRERSGDAGEINEQQTAWRPGDDPSVEIRADQLPGDERPIEAEGARGADF